MKKQSNTLFAKIGNSVLADLTKEVKETIAFIAEPAAKVFTVADLWSIQRHAKTRLQRRFL